MDVESTTKPIYTILKYSKILWFYKEITSETTWCGMSNFTGDRIFFCNKLSQIILENEENKSLNDIFWLQK